VDGRNPAPVHRWFIPLFTGFLPSQVVQDFFHPQYVYYICKLYDDAISVYNQKKHVLTRIEAFWSQTSTGPRLSFSSSM
jgi:hypothetical protein